jgi:hypothetical protein
MATHGSKTTNRQQLSTVDSDKEGKKKFYQVNRVLGQRGDAMWTFFPSHHLTSKSFASSRSRHKKIRLKKKNMPPCHRKLHA